MIKKLKYIVKPVNRPGENIVGGNVLAGNYWSTYKGVDDGINGRVAGDGIGDTDLPYTSTNTTGDTNNRYNKGIGIKYGGDSAPLVKTA